MAGNALMGALLAVQKEAPKLQRDKINPAFRSKYLSLEKLMEQVLPVLNDNGLVWITAPEQDAEGRPVLRYSLVLAEGSTQVPNGSPPRIEGVMPLMLDKSTPQGQGSAITYARRYALMAVLGLVADEDDDGNAASSMPARRRTARAAAPSRKGMAGSETLTKVRALIRGTDEATARLALVAVGVDADGKVGDAIKGLTQVQAEGLIEHLSTKE